MKFVIEQVALYPLDKNKAIKLLQAMGAAEWVVDQVGAQGYVQGIKRSTRNARNVANLAFNYQMGVPACYVNPGKVLELEVLEYIHGPNWMETRGPSVSHLGMHCTSRELIRWRKFFARRDIGIVQEVHTQSHSNSAIAGKRWYQYVIFDTRPILGVDIKMIVRKNKAPKRMR